MIYKVIFGEVYSYLNKWSKTEGVICYTDCKASWGIFEINLIWFDFFHLPLINALNLIQFYCLMYTNCYNRQTTTGCLYEEHFTTSVHITHDIYLQSENRQTTAKSLSWKKNPQTTNLQIISTCVPLFDYFSPILNKYIEFSSIVYGAQTVCNECYFHNVHKLP